MKTFSRKLPRPGRQQKGIVTAMAAVILVAAVIYVLAQTFGIIGTTSLSNAAQRESVAAFFVAESGVETAMSIIGIANQANRYTAGTCTGLTAPTRVPFGIGADTFEFSSATCGVDPPCAECTVTVLGKAGAAARRIETRISTVILPGTEACGYNPELFLTASETQHGIFTNLAYRAKTVAGMCGGAGGSNANIGSCTIKLAGVVAQNCAPITEGWSLEGTGTQNVSSLGVFTTATFTVNNTYTISQQLVNNNGDPAPRNYVQVGVLLSAPGGGTLALTGAYGSKNETTGTSQTTGSVPANWNCAKDSGTAAARRAAGASTLLYGFSSWPTIPNSQLNGVLVGTQPLRRLVTMPGNQGDNLYSQIWYSYNNAYEVIAVNSGAIFTGTIGAEFKGGTNAALTTLTLDSNIVADELLTVGDTIKNSAGISHGTLGTLRSGTAGRDNAVYNFISNSLIGARTNLTAHSTVLRLASAPSSGTVTNGATITNRAGTTTYGTVSGCTGNVAGSTCTLSSPPSPLQVASSRNNMLASTSSVNSNTIVISGGIPTPEVGTALTVISGTGSFPSTTVTGTINATTLTLTLPLPAADLSPGDALFGANIMPNTQIVSGSGTTYSVTPSQSAATASIIARTAVVTSASSNNSSSITVSRDVLLTSAQICGGVCAMLNQGSSTIFALTNIIAGDDWASGFACVAGVNPASIKILEGVSTLRTSWKELVN